MFLNITNKKLIKKKRCKTQNHGAAPSNRKLMKNARRLLIKQKSAAANVQTIYTSHERFRL